MSASLCVPGRGRLQLRGVCRDNTRMSVAFRLAARDDVAAVVALLRDDILGSSREDADPDVYLAAFETMRAEGNNLLIVGVEDGAVVATYQLTFIAGLSLGATRRAQIESVRVARRLRGKKIGEAMIGGAEARAGAAGCGVLQLTMNAGRTDARRFYERMGFAPSHIGFKRALD